jgi:phage terminase large subunit GpA-like protein
VCGSTPLDESTSHITRLYGQSDQRIYECPCPACGGFAELRWSGIEWPEKPLGRRGAQVATATALDGIEKLRRISQGFKRAANGSTISANVGVTITTVRKGAEPSHRVASLSPLGFRSPC